MGKIHLDKHFWSWEISFENSFFYNVCFESCWYWNFFFFKNISKYIPFFFVSCK